ncbi:hypothetical protein [Mycobacteroides chelonae]|uniref:Uncharacterized protein n=1 Tax=Mycobacteroides chelonae TaxID=1774 RepID=A0AB73U7S0_MYCCH|nr:hypothetical protein [Mycobacteroides chelonae]QDF72343.1 hypothetical protein FJK96_20725 [Mycobacteroides chelonae]
MTEPSEAQKLIAAALDQGIVAALSDSGWVSNIEDDEGAVIPTTIRVDGVIDLTALAAEIDKALGGLKRVWGAQMMGEDEVTTCSEGTARFCAERYPLAWTAQSHWASEWMRMPNA